MRAAGLVAASVVACAAAVVVCGVEEPPDLSDVALGSGCRWAADSSAAEVAVLDTGERELRWWDADGELLGSCRLAAMAVEGEVSAFAWRDGTALVTFLQPTAGQEQKRQAFLIDADQCVIERQIDLEGWVMSLAGSEQGWLVELLDPMSEGSSVVALDDEGRTVWEVDVARAQRELLERLGLADAFGASGLRVLPAGRDVWVLPNAAYELWYPRQHGRSFRRVVPQECLRLEAKRLSAAESRAELEARFAGVDEDTAALLAPVMEADQVASFASVVVGAAGSRSLAALAVRDDESPSGRRIDVWDLDRDAVVAILPATPAATPVLLTDDRLWLLEDGQFVTRELQPALQPLGKPCETLAGLREGGDQEQPDKQPPEAANTP